MNQQELKKINDGLPKNGKIILSNEFGLSVSQINKILNGSSNNLPVIERSIQLALKEKRRVERISEKVKSL